MRLWATIEASAKKAKSPALIYQEAELPLRVTRDLFTGDFERLLVDHDRTHKRIVGYLKKTSPHMVERVTRYKEREPLLEAFGVEQEIKSTLNRRVDLPSGGYLIFDYAEAFTVIDVNTGRFVGSRSKRNGPGRLEDTITKNNLEAVKEVVRQLRLRDVGGIIVIDFIDMANPKNRQQVEDALRQELERDRTKTYVVEISPLGLVEMTRQNVTDGPREVMTRKCPTCDGDGIVVSESTAAVEVERRIRGLVTPGSRAKAFKVELNAKVAELLVGPDGSRLQELEEVTKRRFFFVGVEDVHLDHMRVIDQGTVEKLAPAAPVEPGQELELKLGEVGLHDAHAGVGQGQGIRGGRRRRSQARRQEGSRAHHRGDGGRRLRRPGRRRGGVDRADHGRGRGREADAGEAPVEGGCRADAEADGGARRGRGGRRRGGRRSGGSRSSTRREPAQAGAAQAGGRPGRRLEVAAQAGGRRRGRRGRRGRRAARAQAAAGRGSPPSLPRRRPPRRPRPSTTDAEPDAEAADGETPAPAKKRTRRGTRGGRNRKRKPTAATNGRRRGRADCRRAGGAGRARGPEEPAAPVIHLPERDLGRNGDEPDGQDEPASGEGGPQRRPTRRGSRGGRNRRRKPAGAADRNRHARRGRSRRPLRPPSPKASGSTRR